MRLFNALLILKCIQIAKSSNILRAEQPLCNSKLGMMSGFIADSALSVSSYKSTAYSATSSRPNSLNGWCPIEPTTKIGKSWIKVKLKHIMEISSLEINVTSNENSFRPFEIILDYYRDHHNSSRETWRRYKFLDKDKKIHLSTGTNVIKLFPRIVARGLYIRQVPNGRCIRFELYGCEFKDNLVSYAYGNTPDIVDKTFDETSSISNGDIYTIGGLGVLTDGILGVDNYKLDSKHEWVGWRRDYVVKYDSQNYLTTKNLRTDGLLSVPSGQFISLYFIFEDIRNFSYLMIHSNNFFHEEIQLLRAAVVSFSDLDEHYFRNATIHYEQQDLEFDMARPVMITLNNKIGSQVRVDLYFQSRWLLISEVLFESKVVKMDDGNFTQLDGKYIPRSSLRFDNKQNTDQSRSEIPSALSSLIILFCCTIILLLSTIALLIIKSRKLKETIRFKTDYKKSLNGWINSNCSSDQHKQLYHANSVNDECDEASDKLSGQSPQSSAFTMMSFEKTRGHKLAEIKSNFGSSLYSSCKNCKCRWELSPIDTRFRQCGCYSSLKYPQRSTASIFNSQQYCRHHSNPTDKPVISSNALYSQFQDYQLEDDGRMYDHIDTKVIIRKEEQIGSSSDYELYNGSFLVQCSENVYEEDARCVIKVLKQNACAFSRLAFNRDAQIMENCSAHPNILKVMLSAVKEIPPHVVFEHNGTELPEFLQNNKNKLSSLDLTYFGIQICNALIHLNDVENCLHCDIATRNCIVQGEHLQLRIGNLAQLNKKYVNQYWWHKGPNAQPLPLRWLPCDFFHTHCYNLKSSVWSFGITLWEIFTYSGNLPYVNLSNRQVLKLFWDLNSGECQEDIFNIMADTSSESLKKRGDILSLIKTCISTEEERRPKYDQIQKLLESISRNSNIL